jgi:hypothetical protein
MITEMQHAALLSEFQRLGVRVVHLGRAEHSPSVLFEGHSPNGVHVVNEWPESLTPAVLEMLRGQTDAETIWSEIRKLRDGRPT